jgi:DNA-binding LytR/AlgR family response regulator
MSKITVSKEQPMIKIIWQKEDFNNLSERLKNEYDVELITDPTEISHHHVGIMIEEKDYERIAPILKSISKEHKTVFFETKQGWVQQNVLDISHIESFGDEIYLHTQFHQTRVIAMPLYQLESLLKPYDILRISKSYMVNIRYIVYIRTTLNGKLDLELSTGTHLDVTRSFVKSFKDALGILNKEDKK